MAKSDGFPEVFAALQRLLAPDAAELTIMAETEARYSLDADQSRGLAELTGRCFARYR